MSSMMMMINFFIHLSALSILIIVVLKNIFVPFVLMMMPSVFLIIKNFTHILRKHSKPIFIKLQKEKKVENLFFLFETNNLYLYFPHARKSFLQANTHTHMPKYKLCNMIIIIIVMIIIMKPISNKVRVCLIVDMCICM